MRLLPEKNSGGQIFITEENVFGFDSEVWVILQNVDNARHTRTATHIHPQTVYKQRQQTDSPVKAAGVMDHSRQTQRHPKSKTGRHKIIITPPRSSGGCASEGRTGTSLARSQSLRHLSAIYLMPLLCSLACLVLACCCSLFVCSFVQSATCPCPHVFIDS